MKIVIRRSEDRMTPAPPSERFIRRARYGAAVADETGIDEAMIALQVRRFYEAARFDPVLGPIFARVTDWESHLARITDFWSSVALMSGRYHGNPLERHRLLPIAGKHFARWLALWRATAVEICPAPAAARFTLLAERIAASLSRAAGVGPSGTKSFRADRDQTEAVDRVKMLAKQIHRADCVSPCKRNSL